MSRPSPSTRTCGQAHGRRRIVEFRSVVDAVRCAIEVQHGMVERNAGVPTERRIEFRIGIHLGDVVEESDGDLMGDGVNIASRLEGIADPGAICLSEDAYRQVKARLDLMVSDLGDTQLKNIAEPIRVYSLELARGPRKGAVTPEPSRALLSTAAPLSYRSPCCRLPTSAVMSSRNISPTASPKTSSQALFKVVSAVRDRSPLFLHFQGQARERSGGGSEPRRALRAGGQRPQIRQQVRITAQLIDTTTGGHLWAERFDRDLTDIFAVQDDVTQQIIDALAINLTKGDQLRLATEQTQQPGRV